jgi:hypothetical protein
MRVALERRPHMKRDGGGEGAVRCPFFNLNARYATAARLAGLSRIANQMFIL